jgi:uncharacterized membrane protein YhaH (DUF805 family)
VNIFSTEGRIGRLVYFLWLLALIVIASVVMAIFSMDVNSGAYVLVGIPLALLSVFPAVRRLHDLNKSEWLFLLSFIPLVNLGFGLYLLFAKGTQGANRYGDPPVLRWPGTHSLADTVALEGRDEFYQKAYEELENGQVDKALWAKLFVQFEGNENKAKA